MNIKLSIVVASMLGLIGGAARAQASFEGSVTNASETAAAGISQSKADATPYAKSILCPKPPKESGLPDGLRFYTRLNGIGPRESLPEEGKGQASVHYTPLTKDETGAELTDNFGEAVTRTKLHFSAYSCDTQDYDFTFDMDGLVRTSPQKQSGPVKAYAVVETRGYIDYKGDLDCTAYW